MPNNSPVVLDLDGPLAVITLTPPPPYLFDKALIDALTGAVQRVAARRREACGPRPSRAVSGGRT